jgi:hypothetical protein
LVSITWRKRHRVVWWIVFSPLVGSKLWFALGSRETYFPFPKEGNDLHASALHISKYRKRFPPLILELPTCSRGLKILMGWDRRVYAGMSS